MTCNTLIRPAYCGGRRRGKLGWRGLRRTGKASSKKASVFFFEKKKQKTFVHLGLVSVDRPVSRWRRGYKVRKVFLVLFFQKKNCLLYFFRNLNRPACFSSGTRDEACLREPRDILEQDPRAFGQGQAFARVKASGMA
jgi:hypothetical protein